MLYDLLIELLTYLFCVYTFDTSLYTLIIMQEGIYYGIELLLVTCSSSISTVKIEPNNIMGQYNERIYKNIRKLTDIFSLEYNQNYLDIVNKYIWIGLLLATKLAIQSILWINIPYWLYCIYGLLAGVSIRSIIARTQWFNYISNYIRLGMKYLANYILSKITARLINNTSICILGTNPEIEHSEIFKFYENIEYCKELILSISKAIASYIIIYICKNNPNRVIKYIFTFVHKYRIEEFSIFADSSGSNLTKDEIHQLIVNKDWDKLISQKTINSIGYILSNAPKSNYFDKKLAEFGFDLLRFFTCWTFCTINQYFGLIMDLLITHKVTIGHVLGIFTNSHELTGLVVVYSQPIINILIGLINEKNLNKSHNALSPYIYGSVPIVLLSHYYIFILLLLTYNYPKLELGISWAIYGLSWLSGFATPHIIILCLLSHILSFRFYPNLFINTQFDRTISYEIITTEADTTSSLAEPCEYLLIESYYPTPSIDKLTDMSELTDSNDFLIIE